MAGSERAKKARDTTNLKEDSDRQREAISINRSLSTLNACIRSLCNKNVNYIPYRDSMLTWILQDSLGGNAKTVLIATVSPSVTNYSETISTLRYASKVSWLVVVILLAIELCSTIGIVFVDMILSLI